MASDTPTPFRYDARLADEIERRWQGRWEEAKAFRTPNPGDAGFDASKQKFYCLDMFPYPSGAGLHVGHPEGYTATDILCRARRMQGFNVLHPMGWDAFGLPAEQYAVQTGVHPSITTGKAIDNFRRQLKRFGFSYDWSREFATIDPDYVKWTQWIWLQAYDSWYDRSLDRARPISELLAELEGGTRQPDGECAGMPWEAMEQPSRRAYVDARRLAYLGTQTVNWCPTLGTVLANEEIIDGRSERGGHPVARLPLKQWMFRITAYADRLLADLSLVDWPESTRAMQTEWIGRSEGAEINFAVEGFGDLRVFTTRPDTLFGATSMVVAPEHPLVSAALASPSTPSDMRASLRAYVEAARNRSDLDRQAECKVKTGAPTGLHATNPATGERIPVWTADYVLLGYGTGAIMAVPAHDQRDFECAQAFALPILEVVRIEGAQFDGTKATTGDGVAFHSASSAVSIDGLPTAAAKAKIIEWLESTGRGTRRVNYRLRDWLFSRQRYWGEPFPIVYDEAGNHYPISSSALPLTLPAMVDYQPIESDTPLPPLGKVRDWVQTTAGAAGVDPSLLPPSTPVRRETNTMPGWAGSCWYELRYCDPHNEHRFVGEEAERYWMGQGTGSRTAGVDLYVGGSEHAVLHLLYARFWHKLLFDLGHVSAPEPFAKLFHQGLITSHAYQRADKSLVPVDEVEERDGVFIERATGGAVTPIVAKMSKSLRNVINPDDVIAEYGADTFRLYEMAMGPLEASKPWNTRDIAGVFRFLQRAWRLCIDESTGEPLMAREPDPAIERALHRTIKKVSDDIDRLAFNTAIAAMIEFVNAATRATGLPDQAEGGLTREQADRFIRLLAPFAPHLAEEAWRRLGHPTLVSHAAWPAADPAMLVDSEVEVPVQVLGKVRARIMVPAAIARDASQLEAFARSHADVAPLIQGKTVRRVIAVPSKLVNFVV
ncbi:MAG: leucine--tRNA ligase [Planctomycetota bacterium]|nr:leucine--tRNA ligase [Planctomycetota bacterium]MDA1105947.1 leucine--tRNA ligase [Planctomycetota bacterium]